MSACHEGEPYYRSESFSLSRSPFEARYLLARVPGAKKDGGDHLLSTNTQHIARLGREVQPEPAKEGRKGADDLTGGEVWDRGFDSLPWHHRSDAHDSTTSEFFIRREVAYLPQGRKPDKWRFESSSGHQTQ